MANIITPDFRARNVTSFVEDVKSNIYYTFVSSMEETDTLNSEFSKREFLEKTLFGKAVENADVYYMVKNTRWTSGTVYDMYDDKADLTNKNFFVTVYPDDQETGEYYIFKCLGNNFGAPATDQPTYNPGIPDQTYNTTDDGYVWKYLFTISNFEFRTLSTNNLIPIIEDAATTFSYSFDASTANSDPGTGKLRFSNTNISLATSLYIDSSPTGVSDFLTTLDVSTNDIKGYFRITNANDKTEFFSFYITDITQETGYFNLDCKYMFGGSTSFASNTDVSIAFTLEPDAIDGIEHILITNPGESYGYQSLTGTISAIETLGGNVTVITIASLNGAEASQTTDYYTGQSISITQEFGSNAGTRQYTVANWTPTSQTTGLIELEETVSETLIDVTCTFIIVPRIEIIGDGTGASAIPVVDTTNGTITSIQILSIGSGYTNATARIVDPPFDFQTTGLNINANRCLIRPIISPRNGHSYDIKEELLCRHALINTEITEVNNSDIPTSRTYTKLGLVKNPEFSADADPVDYALIFDNRIRITLTSSTGINIDDILYQNDANLVKTFEGKVHSIDGNDIYLTNYNGPYVNQTNSDISFDTSLPLKNSIGQTFDIAANELTLPDVTLSPYVQRTGEVFYINTFNPIERTAFSLEQYKILLQF